MTEQEIERIGKVIVNSAFNVHKELGPGLLEKVYEIPIVYDGLEFEEGLRLDVLVEDKVICEIKAIELVNPVWDAQVLSHLKLTEKRLGYLINFNVVNIGQGIKRFVL